MATRPWPIHAFAVIFMVTGLVGLVSGLLDLGAWTLKLTRLYPGVAWDQDRTIVFLSARASIFCIPILLVWGLRRSRARWVLGFFTGVGLLGALWALGRAAQAGGLEGFNAHLATNAPSIATSVALALAASLLFTRTAKEWLIETQDNDDPVAP